MSDDQFDKIAQAITEKHVTVVKDALDQSKITDLDGFYDAYRQEQLAIDEQFASPVNANSSAAIKLELFADVFKYLDTFPSNLQKPKKTPAMRERLNSTISKSSPSLSDLTSNHQNNTSTTSINANKCEDLPKPTDTYKSFLKFQKQLHQLSQDLADQRVDQEYTLKLKQLRNFSQQLDKILPKENTAATALTVAEEKALDELVGKMEDVNFIRDNQDVYRQNSNGGIFNNTQRLESLVDIISHSILAVNSFKIV